MKCISSNISVKDLRGWAYAPVQTGRIHHLPLNLSSEMVNFRGEVKRSPSLEIIISAQKMSHRYNKWTQYEDSSLSELVGSYGAKNWSLICAKMKTHYGISKRNGKQCRQRWFNHLSSEEGRLQWDDESNRRLIALQAIHGTRWIEITQHFKDKCDNNVKNHFYAIVRKGIRHMCRQVGLKTNEARVYQIRPSTISQVYYEGGQVQAKEEAVGSKTTLNTFYTPDRILCREITHIINSFIFAEERKKAAHTPEKVKWAIDTLVEINQHYQRESEELRSRRNPTSKEESSGEPKSHQMKPEVDFSSSEYLPDSDSSELRDGIFSGGSRPRGDQFADRSNVIEKCRSANFLEKVRPQFEPAEPIALHHSLNLCRQDSQLSLGPVLNPNFSLCLDELEDCVIEEGLVEFKTPHRSRSHKDIFERFLE